MENLTIKFLFLYSLVALTFAHPLASNVTDPNTFHWYCWLNHYYVIWCRSSLPWLSPGPSTSTQRPTTWPLLTERSSNWNLPRVTSSPPETSTRARTPTSTPRPRAAQSRWFYFLKIPQRVSHLNNPESSITLKKQTFSKVSILCYNPVRVWTTTWKSKWV